MKRDPSGSQVEHDVHGVKTASDVSKPGFIDWGHHRGTAGEDDGHEGGDEFRIMRRGVRVFEAYQASG